MHELEDIVEQLEAGELSLDKSLQQFERGVKLSRDCQTALDEAEQKVEVLLGDELQEFSPDEDDR
jgi:exodeoxyribonuclease VII small subunit